MRYNRLNYVYHFTPHIEQSVCNVYYTSSPKDRGYCFSVIAYKLLMHNTVIKKIEPFFRMSAHGVTVYIQ